MSIKLDYTLQSPEERKRLVEQFLEENPDPNEKQLEILADYLVLAMEKQERKEKKILTENRLITVGKREAYFEDIASQFKNGKDGIYNLITEDKNQLFQPKEVITEKDLQEIPFLRQLREAVQCWKKCLKTAASKSAYIIKKTIIDLQKDQYLVKKAYRKPIETTQVPQSSPYFVPLDSEEEIIDGKTQYSGVSLLNPKVISNVLQDYSQLKAAAEGEFMSDTWYFMEDFDEISSRALKNYPYYERLVELKVDGKQNAEIQEILRQELGIKHSLEYISTLWRRKIPKLIAAEAEEEFLDWWFLTQEKGKYKKCGRCGQIKLAHNKYFSKNNTSGDGWYSVCKQCRSR